MNGGYRVHALSQIATHCGRHPNAKLSISVCYASSYSGLRRCREEALGTGDPGSDVVRNVMLSHETGTADGREAGASIPLSPCGDAVGGWASGAPRRCRAPPRLRRRRPM